MPFNREIGMKIGSLTFGNRSAIVLQVIIICSSLSTTIVESAALYAGAKKRNSYDYYLKNREKSSNGNFADRGEYDGALSYRDLYVMPRTHEQRKVGDSGPKIRDNSRNQIMRSVTRNFDRPAGMTRILTFPLKHNDNQANPINDFAPGDPAADCLAGGVDAGVVNGALKIGIGLGLAPGCGTSTEHTPKLVPLFVPRPIPVPVAVPQPYPVAVDRPVAIRVPQPIPFPAFNMGSIPGMASMQQLTGRFMTGRGW